VALELGEQLAPLLLRALDRLRAEGPAAIFELLELLGV
jgi:hypothetical protein